MAELGAHNTGVPCKTVRHVASPHHSDEVLHTVRPGDLAPDHPNVGTPDLTLGPVNESDLLAQVEFGGAGVINTLDLDQTVAHIRFRSPSSDTICAGVGTSCWGW